MSEAWRDHYDSWKLASPDDDNEPDDELDSDDDLPVPVEEKQG